MSIKSDKWMRRMVEQHGMIEPFEPGQVRYDADGHRIVSYGTSSYGYDVRCANPTYGSVFGDDDVRQRGCGKIEQPNLSGQLARDSAVGLGNC